MERRGVSGTTVKWLRCYHGDSNEGVSGHPGGTTEGEEGSLGGGRRREKGKWWWRGWEGQEWWSWRGRKYTRPAGFFLVCFFLGSDKLTVLTHIMLQCSRGNVLHDVGWTFTHHIILCKLLRKTHKLILVWKHVPRVPTFQNPTRIIHHFDDADN